MIEEPKCRPSFATSNYIALFLTRKSDGICTNGTVSPSPEVELDPSLSLPMFPLFLHPTAYKGKSELTMFFINRMRNPLVVSSKTQSAYIYFYPIHTEIFAPKINEINFIPGRTVFVTSEKYRPTNHRPRTALCH